MLSSYKYNLVDITYSHAREFMKLYRHVKYWLSYFEIGGLARGKEEKFKSY